MTPLECAAKALYQTAPQRWAAPDANDIIPWERIALSVQERWLAGACAVLTALKYELHDGESAEGVLQMAEANAQCTANVIRPADQRT
jgi:hypothetical protein